MRKITTVLVNYRLLYLSLLIISLISVIVSNQVIYYSPAVTNNYNYQWAKIVAIDAMAKNVSPKKITIFFLN